MLSVYVVLGSKDELILVYDPTAVPRYTLYPLTVDVLGIQERLTLYCGETPVPLRDSVSFALVEVVNVSVAEADPLAEGANTTFTRAL